MADYISRDDVLKAIDYQHEVNNVFESEAAYVQMWETINDDMGIKSADVQPVKHGKWLKASKTSWNNYKCSLCNTQYVGMGAITFTYCPNCGARMIEDGDTNG